MGKGRGVKVNVSIPIETWRMLLESACIAQGVAVGEHLVETGAPPEIVDAARDAGSTTVVKLAAKVVGQARAHERFSYGVQLGHARASLAMKVDGEG